MERLYIDIFNGNLKPPILSRVFDEQCPHEN